MILVKSIMNKKVISISPGMSLKRICQLLTMHKLNGIPVINLKKEIIGFVSERNIIAAISKPNFHEKCARDIMAKKVIAVEDNANISEVAQIFSVEPFRQLPVVREGKLVGMITRNDIVKRMLGHYY